MAGLLFLLCLVGLYVALLPVSIARPAQHSHFPKRHKHHRHHTRDLSSQVSEEKAYTRISLVNLELPPTASPQLPNISEAIISVSFQSISQWPKSGEQVDLVSVPRGVWLTPGDKIPLAPLLFLRLT